MVEHDVMLVLGRFVEYWARIGSEDNMTMCHRPTCRREGVLLDYSTDGGGLLLTQPLKITQIKTFTLKHF